MTLVYQEPLISLYQGHVLDVLARMEPQSVHCIVTSPPYFSLRDYQTEPQIWGDMNCKHRWGETIPQDSRHRWTPENSGTKHTASGEYPKERGQWCQVSGCWQGQLGLEQPPFCQAAMQGQACADQCYLGHLLQVADELFRVLRDDGCFFLNMGDSYAGSWGNQGRKQNRGTQRLINGPMMQQVHDDRYPTNGHHTGTIPSGTGLKPKDLCGMPWRTALALQARGWTLRSAFSWIKENSMPESVQDRPSVSTEMVFLFSKKATYFWDPDAIRQPLTGHRNNTIESHQPGNTFEVPGTSHFDGHSWRMNPNGRNRRTGDWWKESLDRLIADTDAWLTHAKQVRAQGGLLLSPDGEPLGLQVNPQPFSGAHFAVFPEDLVTPLIKASTSEKGCCSTCLAPWIRVVEHLAQPNAFGAGGGPKAEFSEATRLAGGIGRMDGGRRAVNGSSFNNNPAKRPGTGQTTGWKPSCHCVSKQYVELRAEEPYGPLTNEAYERLIAKAIVQTLPIPCTVLDPFLGSGTSALVARNLGRRAVGIELSPAYLELAIKRLRQQVLPFAEVQAPARHEHDATQAEMAFDA